MLLMLFHFPPSETEDKLNNYKLGLFNSQSNIYYNTIALIQVPKKMLIGK